MSHFFDMIDLSENLGRSLRAVRGITSLPALILAAALGLLSCVLGLLAWHFDITSTVDWTNIAIRQVMPSLPNQAADYASVFILAITVSPTLVELFTARFAQVGIRVAAGLVYTFSLFDLITDAPRAFAFVDAYGAAFAGMGLLAGPAIIIAKVLWLMLASFGFEMLFINFTLTTLALLIQSGRRHLALGA